MPKACSVHRVLKKSLQFTMHGYCKFMNIFIIFLRKLFWYFVLPQLCEIYPPGLSYQ